MVAGCYMGYDTPRTMGPGAFGGTLCVPIFEAFMKEAVKRFGGTAFKDPAGRRCFHQHRPLFRCAIARWLHWRERAGGIFPRRLESRVFGLGALVDGGFGMGQDLPLFAAGETDQGDLSLQSETIVNGNGETSTVQKKAKFGSTSSGGLY